MIPNLGELAVRSRRSVQIQQDPLLIGYGKEDPTLQKEAEWQRLANNMENFRSLEDIHGEMSCREFDVQLC